MQFTIPDSDKYRIVLPHDGSLNGTDEGFAQGQAQNQQIVEFAKGLADGERFVTVEVFYSRTDIEASSTEHDFDALLVDVVKGEVIGTLPAYSTIDPDWLVKRYNVDMAS